MANWRKSVSICASLLAVGADACASVPQTWEPDAQTLRSLVTFLAGQHVDLQASDVSANADWLKHQIRFRVISSLYGLDAGYKTLMQVDPEVLKAMTLLPQAADLEARARKVLAAREAAGK